MKSFLILIAFYGGFVLISWLISTISELVVKHREKVKDQVLQEVLGDLDIENIIKDYKYKLSYIKHQNQKVWPDSEANQINPEFGTQKTLFTKCPSCHVGYLVPRGGKFGSFIGCSRYPDCKHTQKLLTTVKGSKNSIEEQILNDIKRAYSNT